MTVDELLRRGGECEAAKDVEGAEQAYRQADDLADPEGAIRLGLVLKRRGNLRSAAEAFQRAEARGHPEAASCLGNLLWGNGDLDAAGAAYQRSVAAGSAAAVLNLGLLLAQQGAVDQALTYLRAAEERSPAEASWAIGKLLEDQDDLSGAEPAYRRASEAGNADAAYGLGAVLLKLNRQPEARVAFERARELGHEGAGKLLESLQAFGNTVTVRDVIEAATEPQMIERQDGEPVIAPLMEGEERLLQTVHRPDGNRNDIYLTRRRPTDDQTMGTGEPINFVAIIRSSEADPNDTPPSWPWQRGPTERSIYIALAQAYANVGVLPGHSVSLDPDVRWFADRIQEDAGPTPSGTEVATRWAQLYAGACQEVLGSANSCLEVANEAIGARNVAAQRPQHEISIRHFTEMAEQKEQEFASLFARFEEVCAQARETASNLLTSQSSRAGAELMFAMVHEQDVLDQAATAKAILRARFGSTPAGFVDGVERANALMHAPDDETGNIYTPLPHSEPDERTCPWCAETIKTAAVICRFCGRDVNVQPNVAPLR